MNLLRLGLEFRLQLRLGLHALARVRLRADVNVVHRRAQVGQHERVRVFRAHEIPALLGQVGLVAFLVHREEQLLLLRVELHLLLVRVQRQLRVVHQLQVRRFFQHLQQRLGTAAGRS